MDPGHLLDPGLVLLDELREVWDRGFESPCPGSMVLVFEVGSGTAQARGAVLSFSFRVQVFYFAVLIFSCEKPRGQEGLKTAVQVM